MVQEGLGVPAGEVNGYEDRLDEDEGVREVAVAQRAKGVATPDLPSPDEVTLPDLTHLPYRSWCKWCGTL